MNHFKMDVQSYMVAMGMIDKDIEESNGSDKECDLDDHEEQTGQPTTETEEPFNMLE